MFAETRLEKLATLGNRFEPRAGCVALAIVSAQITKGLFALKDRRRSSLLRVCAVGGNVDPVPALGQAHFHGARRKSLRLRP